MPAEALMRMAIGLVFVVLAILACAWLARRAGLGATTPRRMLREIDALRMGPRHRISVIEIDGTRLVVGISATHMTLLHTQPTTAPDVDAVDMDRVASDRVASDRVASDRVAPDRVAPDRVGPDAGPCADTTPTTALARVLVASRIGSFSALLAHARDRRWNMRDGQ